MNGNQIDRMVHDLRMKEQSNTINGRMNIITYKWGKTVHSILYSIRFPDQKKAHQQNAKLELGDTLTMINILCQELGFNFDEVRELGLLHTSERYDEFEQNKWKKIE